MTHGVENALTEDQIRRKVVELFDHCNMVRMNMWLSSGVIAGVLDADVVERVMVDEIERRSQHVREYWLDEPCTCQGRPN